MHRRALLEMLLCFRSIPFKPISEHCPLIPWNLPLKDVTQSALRTVQWKKPLFNFHNFRKEKKKDRWMCNSSLLKCTTLCASETYQCTSMPFGRITHYCGRTGMLLMVAYQKCDIRRLVHCIPTRKTVCLVVFKKHSRNWEAKNCPRDTYICQRIEH